MAIPSTTNDPHGYDRLARLMGRYRDMSIFRRFGALAAQKLLYMQAELQQLEILLREQQEKDRTSSHPNRSIYHRSWVHLIRSADEDAPEGNDSRQLELMREIDEKLERYHETLLRQQQIMQLQKPTSRQVKALADWMDRPDRGDVFLRGPDRHIWNQPDLDDLATMDSGDVAASRLIPDLKPETSEDLRNTIVYNDYGVFSAIKTLATMIACLLLMASITVLYIVKDMPLRIGLTAIFTCAFALSLNLTTDAKIKDIFSATATFTAVLVVFIGTSDNTG